MPCCGSLFTCALYQDKPCVFSSVYCTLIGNLHVLLPPRASPSYPHLFLFCLRACCEVLFAVASLPCPTHHLSIKACRQCRDAKFFFCFAFCSRLFISDEFQMQNRYLNYLRKTPVMQAVNVNPFMKWLEVESLLWRLRETRKWFIYRKQCKVLT